MYDLKKMVKELFEQDQLVQSLEKDIKTVRAHYHHLILKNSEKVYSDQEILAIKDMHDKLSSLQEKQSGFLQRKNEIQSALVALINPLNGGRWVHETEDFLHPRMEFWVENDELKYARLNGTAY